MEKPMIELGMRIRLHATFDEALTKVADALRSEGFGVLTEIDVRGTLKNKLDVEFRNYRILGACNPSLAHRALTADAEVGLLLPCNVTVDEIANNLMEVSILNPAIMVQFFDVPAVAAVADETKVKLERVAAELRGN